MSENYLIMYGDEILEKHVNESEMSNAIGDYHHSKFSNEFNSRNTNDMTIEELDKLTKELGELVTNSFYIVDEDDIKTKLNEDKLFEYESGIMKNNEIIKYATECSNLTCNFIESADELENDNYDDMI